MYESLKQEIDNLGVREQAKYDSLHTLRQLDLRGKLKQGTYETDNAIIRANLEYPGSIERKEGFFNTKYKLTSLGKKILTDSKNSIDEIQQQLDLEETNPLNLEARLTDFFKDKNITKGEYLVAKMILYDGLLDSENPGYISRRKGSLGLELTTKIEKNSKIKTRISERSTSDNYSSAPYNGGTDNMLLWYMMMPTFNDDTSKPTSSPPDTSSSDSGGFFGGFFGGGDSNDGGGSHSGCGGGSDSGSSGCGGGSSGCGGGGCGGGCGGA
jgi:hypothetical protein